MTSGGRRRGPIVAAVAACVLFLGVRGQAETASPADDPWDIRSQSSYAAQDAQGARTIGFVDDVVVTHGEMIATSDEARYYSALQRAILRGNVVMEQDSSQVMGPLAFYDRAPGIARFPTGVLIQRPTGTTVADQGVWWRTLDKLELKGRVQAADTSGTLEGSSATYDFGRELFYVVGDAKFVDDVSGAVVEGQDLRYYRHTGLATATGDPRVSFVDEDSVEVRVRAMRLNYDAAQNFAEAEEDVRIERETMEGRAGRLRYWRDTGRILMTESPELIDGRTSMQGESIEIITKADGYRTIYVRGAGQVSSRLVSTRERPTAAGDDDGPRIGTVDEITAETLEQLAAEGENPLEALARARVETEKRAAEVPGLEPPPDEEIVLPEDPPVPDSTSAEAQVKEALDAVPGSGKGKMRGPGAGPPGDGAGAGGDDAGAGDGEDGEEEDNRPPWLKVPSEQLPTENLLFGDEIVIHVAANEVQRVVVIGHGRSKFYPNEAAGELTEWNDVTGDTLRVWFAEAAVESVVVRGNAVGEYRMPAGEDEGQPRDVLIERGKLVEYQAPALRYATEDEVMRLQDGAQVRFQALTLTSGEIEMDARKGVMTAGGEPAPKLLDQGDEISGQEMLYHLDSQKGQIRTGRTRFENAYYSGQEVWKMSDRELAIHNGYFTTCDLDDPHYHFTTKQMKIYLNDKIVAKPVIFYVRKIPILIVPYYMASLKKGRNSGFLLPNLELGVDDSRGRFIRNMGYYWAPNDYYDAKLTFDFFPQQERFVGRLNNRYNVRYRFSGNVDFTYDRDEQAGRQEYSLRFNHNQTLSETLSLVGSGTFVSAEDIFINTDDEDRLERDLSSRLTLTKRFGKTNQSLVTTLSQNRNLDTGFIRETLPQVDYSLPSRPILRNEDGENAGILRRSLAQTYYNLTAQALHERRESESLGVVTEERNVGSVARSTLRTTLEVGDYVRLTPTTSGVLTWVEEDNVGDNNQFRATYDVSAGATTDLYGMFPQKVGPFQGFRHVITPNATWRWSPEFDEYFFTDSTGVDRDRFPTFGSIGSTPGKTNSMSFSVRNLLQTKVASGGNERRYEIFSLSNSLSYNLLARDQGRESLSSLSSTLNVLSGLPVNQTWRVSHDPYSWGLESSSVTTRVRLSSSMLRRTSSGGNPYEEGAAGEEEADRHEVGGIASILGVTGGIGDWSLDASHTARNTGGSASSSFDLNTRWTPNDRWAVTFSTQYDLTDGQNTGQRWSVHRKIHCWELSFDRRLLGREWQYYLRVNITDLPDLKAERSRGLTGSSSNFGTNSIFGG